MCQSAIKTVRAGEVRQVVEWHASRFTADCSVMMSLTVRHGLGHDLGTVRKGIANAFRSFTAGAPFKRKQEEYGLFGRIRACEVTYGPNGWHPHLHVILLSERPLDDDFARWASIRWQAAVRRQLGDEHCPSDERGCVVTPCHQAEYLQKLGLEISAPNTKNARGGNRTPIQLLADAVMDGDAEALAIYERYCDAMKGARMLTWSRGLKAAAGVTKRTDEEIVEGEDAPESHVLTMHGAAWDAIRNRVDVQLRLLDLAEHNPADAVAYLRYHAHEWPPGFDPILPAPETYTEVTMSSHDERGERDAPIRTAKRLTTRPFVGVIP